MRTPEIFGVRIECLGTQCVHYKTIEMHICMRTKQSSGVCIECRKYLNRCTPFFGVSQCNEGGQYVYRKAENTFSKL